MSSPVGVQWLYWTGIEGCKRGATITYHNHDLYRHTSRIPGAFIMVHVKKKQLLSISVWHLTASDVQQTSQPNEMKFHHAAKMQYHLPMKATAGVFANFTLRETNTMHLWKRKFFSQYWKGLCFFRGYRGTMSIFKLSFCVYEGQNYIICLSAASEQWLKKAVC